MNNWQTKKKKGKSIELDRILLVNWNADKIKLTKRYDKKTKILRIWAELK